MNNLHLDHINSARWFSGKGRGGELTRVQPLDWYGPGPGDGALAVRSEICTVSYPDGDVEHYQLVLAHRATPQQDTLIGSTGEGSLPYVHDATRDPEAMQQVLGAILDTGSGESSWHANISNGGALRGDLAPRVFRGEQSNTNVFLGDVSLMKVFRKLEIGHNLDIQVHDALNRAGVDAVAELHGWVSGQFRLDSGQVVSSDLIMMIEQLKQATDGWDLAVASCAAGEDFSNDAAELGRCLAEIHRALADTFRTSTIHGDAVADVMNDRLDRAVAVAPELAPHRDGLRQIFDELRGVMLDAQRIHGDFHLGQTLGTPAGWRIIDFEGEPMKSLEERQLPDSTWRDVAGMLRSFSYATAGAGEPGGESARQWYRRARESFVSSYQKASGANPEGLLRAYEADKAVYEVVYETRNRPDWVSIPMSTIEHYTQQREI